MIIKSMLCQHLKGSTRGTINETTDSRTTQRQYKGTKVCEAYVSVMGILAERQCTPNELCQPPFHVLA